MDVAGPSDRKLEADCNNTDAPDRKMMKTGEGENIMPGWALVLTSKMGVVETKMGKLDDAVKIDKETKDGVKLTEV